MLRSDSFRRNWKGISRVRERIEKVKREKQQSTELRLEEDFLGSERVEMADQHVGRRIGSAESSMDISRAWFDQDLLILGEEIILSVEDNKMKFRGGD